MRKPVMLWKVSLALVFAAIPLALSVHAGCGGSSGGGGAGGGGNPDAGGGGGVPDSGVGGGGSGSATVNGTVGGNSLRPASSLGASLVLNCPEGSLAIALGGITDYAASCSTIQANKANSTSLLLDVIRLGAQAQQPIAAGTYTITSADGGFTIDPNGNITVAAASFQKLDATCTPTVRTDAIGGTIVISSVTSSRISGTFDLNYSRGDRLTGTFDAPICSSPPLTCSTAFDGGTGAPDAGCLP